MWWWLEMRIVAIPMIVDIRTGIIAAVGVAAGTMIRIAAIARCACRRVIIPRAAHVDCGSPVGHLDASLARRVVTGCTVVCRTARSFSTTGTRGMVITTGTGTN